MRCRQGRIRRRRNLLQIYATYGLFVGCGVGLSYVPALGALQREFAENRGAASAIAGTAIGLGTMFGPATAEFLIDMYGWRPAYLLLALGAAVAGTASALAMTFGRKRHHSPAGDHVG